MYKLVGEDNRNFAILDTTDGSIDVLLEDEVKFLLRVDLEVAGAYLNGDGSLGYSDEYFIDRGKADTATDEGEDDDWDWDDEDDVVGEQSVGSSDTATEEVVEDTDGDDWDDDWDDAEDDGDQTTEESTVTKLYKYLSEEQITVLKRYYLWYSQRIFTDAQKDPTLGMKSQTALKKKADLSNLRNTGGLWHYAGFVDMGYRGAGHCTLGHPLRFMHLAWDVTVSDIETAFFGENYDSNFEDAINSNNCIVFGIKCIADFFEVDKSCVLLLQKSQRESLKDMALMYEHYANGVVAKVCDTFGLLDDLMQKVKSTDSKRGMLQQDYVPIVPFSLTSFYLQFRKLGMIPPKSLVQEIRDRIVGWDSHKFTGCLGYPSKDILLSNLSKLVGNRASAGLELFSRIPSNYEHTMLNRSYRLSTLVLKFAVVWLTYEICGYYKFDGVTNKDEGGTSKSVRAQLRWLYNDLRSQFFMDSEYTVNYFKDLMVVVGDLMSYSQKILGLDRLKFEVVVMDSEHCEIRWCKGDFDSKRASAYDMEHGSDVGSLLREAFQFFSGIDSLSCISVWKGTLNDFKGSVQRYRDILEENLDCYISYMEDSARLELESATKALREEDWRVASMGSMRGTVEKDSSDADEVLDKDVGVSTEDDVISYLKTIDFTKHTDCKFAGQILSTVVSSGKRPSSKQFYYLKTAYEKISGLRYGGKVETDRVNLDDDIAMKKALTEMLNHANDLDARTYDIIKSILKYGTISPKQMKYAEEAKSVYDAKYRV